MPAMRATPRGSALGTLPDLMAVMVEGEMFSRATAVALRSVLDLEETSRTEKRCKFQVSGFRRRAFWPGHVLLVYVFEKPRCVVFALDLLNKPEKHSI